MNHRMCRDSFGALHSVVVDFFLFKLLMLSVFLKVEYKESEGVEGEREQHTDKEH